MCPKIIARYLPQFHQIPENDKWWGKGFTDWVAARNAEPLFENHNQPRVPLGNNYYDLLKKDVMEWQADLAKKYCIYGFSFYHYYFSKGKKILEKPAENLLKWKDIDINYCFSWANEQWVRSWSKFQGNPWILTCEKKEKAGDGLLCEQKYGNEIDWKQHIEYLIPFFKDPRYIKINGRPVFMIHLPDVIFCLPDMIECWNNELRKNKVSEIFLLGESRTPYYLNNIVIDARVIDFPGCVFGNINLKKNKSGVSMYDYKKYWEYLLSGEWGLNEEKTYISAAVDFDNTPRQGARGTVLDGASPNEFKKYFNRLYNQERNKKKEFVFINAWNEWGEGMYLEPDETFKYGYLESIRDVVQSEPIEYHTTNRNVFTGKEKKLIKSWLTDKRNFDILAHWIDNITGKDISLYLLNMGYKRIAVYGYGKLGKILVEKLKETQTVVEYIIDRNPYIYCSSCPVYQLSTDLRDVDAVVVTVAGRYAEIRNDIKKEVNYPTISLEHIIFEI